MVLSKGLQAALNGVCHSTCEYVFSNFDLVLQLEQHSLFGPLQTGATLWCSEILIAEWLAANGNKGLYEVGTCLELGAGVSPVAGFAALALGYDVVFTDVSLPILKHAQRNLEINAEKIFRLRGHGELCKRTVDLLELDFEKPIPGRIVDLAPYSLIICSDCLYRPNIFEGLALTLSHLLPTKRLENTEKSKETLALIAFQERSEDGNEFRFFTEVLPKFGLLSQELDSYITLSTMKVPSKNEQGEYTSMEGFKGLHLFRVFRDNKTM